MALTRSVPRINGWNGVRFQYKFCCTTLLLGYIFKTALWKNGYWGLTIFPFAILQSKTEHIIDITLKISTRSYTWLLLWCPSFHCAPMPGKLMGLLSYVRTESMFLTLSLVTYKVETFSHNVDCLFCHDMSCGITPYGRAITKLIFTGGGL